MSVGGLLISLSVAVETIGGQTTKVCDRDAWPVQRQTYGYLPGRRASPPFGRYQSVVLGDRGTWVSATCLESLPGVHWPRVKPATTKPLYLNNPAKFHHDLI